MATKKINEEIINHFGAARFDVKGNGMLKLVMYSLSLVKAHVMLPIQMFARTYKEPNRISNFTQQRAMLEIRTTEIDETFSISRVLIYIKPVAKSYPE